jgi:hypothetical protein
VVLGGPTGDVLDHHVGRGEAFIGVAADLGGCDVEGRAVELVVPLFRSRGLHAFQVIEDGRQHFVVDRDQAGGLVGDVIRRGGDDGDRRADLEDLFREQKPIGWAAANADIFVEVGQVAPVQDRDDAGERFGLAGIDRFDARMRVRAAEGFHEHHARLAHVFRVLAEAGDVPEAVQAWGRFANDLKRAFGDRPWRRGLRLGVHRQFVREASHDRREQIGVLGGHDVPLG